VDPFQFPLSPDNYRQVCIKSYTCSARVSSVACLYEVRLRFKCNDTRAEVHLNGQGRQFIRILAAEVRASAVVVLDTPCSEVVWRYWIPTPFVSPPFTSPPVRHSVTSRFNWTLIRHPTPKLEDHPLSAVRDSLFNTFSAVLYDWIPSPPSATRGSTISWWQGTNHHG
jgi:hypothetical protein